MYDEDLDREGELEGREIIQLIKMKNEGWKVAELLKKERQDFQSKSREWELKIKKLQEEVDMLAFENQRLRKQNESLSLLNKKKKGVWGWLVGGNGAEPDEFVEKMETLRDELELKIAENGKVGLTSEALHMQIFDAKFRDQTQSQQIELMVTGLRSQLAQKEIQLKNVKQELEKSEAQLDTETKEKKRLRVECEEVRESVDQIKLKLQDLSELLQAKKQDIRQQRQDFQEREASFLLTIVPLFVSLTVGIINHSLIQEQKQLFKALRAVLCDQNDTILEQTIELIQSELPYNELQQQLNPLATGLKMSFPLEEVFAQEKFGIKKEDLEYSVSITEKWLQGDHLRASDVSKLVSIFGNFGEEAEQHEKDVFNALKQLQRVLKLIETRKKFLLLKSEGYNLEDVIPLLKEFQDLKVQTIRSEHLRGLEKRKKQLEVELKNLKIEFRAIEEKLLSRQSELESSKQFEQKLEKWHQSKADIQKTKPEEEEQSKPLYFFLKLIGGCEESDNDQEKQEPSKSEEIQLNSERVAYIQSRAIGRIRELSDREIELENSVKKVEEQVVQREKQVIDLQKVLQQQVERENEREEAQREQIKQYEQQIQMMSEQVVELSMQVSESEQALAAKLVKCQECGQFVKFS